MIIELHAIQSFAPANLNRDDTGAPKECTFGGVRRARVSSQSWKRAMRVQFREESSRIATGTRTKRAHQAIVDRIRAADPDASPEQADHRAAVLLEAKPLDLSLKQATENAEVKTGQLIFFRDGDLDQLAELGIEFGETLDGMPSSLEPADGAATKAAKGVLPAALVKRIKTALTTPGHALDVGLFGRMLAEFAEANIDAACQVAHAIGTHRLSSEFDYFTAVDDLKPDDTEGADMIGTVQFNASCLYRYAVLDSGQLAANLGAAADTDHLQAAVGAFVRAFVTAVPTGKQNTFAARNLPTAVLAVSRTAGPMNLVNAFVEPVDPRAEGGLAAASVGRMLAEFTSLESMYGSRDDATSATPVLLTGVIVEHDVARVTHVDDLIAQVTAGV